MTTTTRALLLVLALALALATAGATAAETATPPVDQKAVAAYKSAFAGQDSSAKKAAVQALASASAGPDSDIIPLLIDQVDDRQASEVVMAALRARTGVGMTLDAPGRGSADRPQRPDDWRAWYTGWKAKKAMAKLEQKVEKQQGGGQPRAAGPAPAVASTPEPAPVRRAAPDDLGKPVRIFFHGGASKMYHIISRRIDADGNLVSLRVAHPDGGGEETLAADIIARIQEGAD